MLCAFQLSELVCFCLYAHNLSSWTRSPKEDSRVATHWKAFIVRLRSLGATMYLLVNVYTRWNAIWDLRISMGTTSRTVVDSADTKPDFGCMYFVYSMTSELIVCNWVQFIFLRIALTTDNIITQSPPNNTSHLETIETASDRLSISGASLAYCA